MFAFIRTFGKCDIDSSIFHWASTIGAQNGGSPHEIFHRHPSTVSFPNPNQPEKVTIIMPQKWSKLASLPPSTTHPLTRESHHLIIASQCNTPHLFPTPVGWCHPWDQCLSDSTWALLKCHQHHQLIGPVEALFSKRQKLVRPKKPGFSKAHFACRDSYRWVVDMQATYNM